MHKLSLFLCAWMGLISLGSAHADVKVLIDTQQAGPEINKNLYGQFSEHLGTGIYGGLWVGPESDIANIDGWRTDVVTALQALSVPVLRWPGGCFADEYHWRDGVGPREQRPATLNTLWGGVKETNAVGTHEYFRLAELLGAETYVNGNLGTGSPQEMAQWIEYMTSTGDSDLANLRRQNGREEPFTVNHFGIGNESWGCGGGMSPEYYTNLYKRYSTFLRPPWGVKVNWVASGGHGYGDHINAGGATGWTEYLSRNIKPDFLLGFDAIAFHYYTHPQGDALTPKGPSRGFTEEHWFSTLSNTLAMDTLLTDNIAVLERTNPDNTLALYIDEWGTWYDTKPGSNPAYLHQYNTQRDALVAALNFNIFHRHAKRVKMANIAGMVNVLQSMVVTEGDKMFLTPTYHAFHMHKVFQGARTLAVDIDKTPLYRLGDKHMPALSVSAARTEAGEIYIALVNTDTSKPHALQLQKASGEFSTATGQLLSADALDAHNSVKQPQRVAPQQWQVKAVDGALRLELPAASMAVLQLH